MVGTRSVIVVVRYERSKREDVICFPGEMLDRLRHA
jgi:hypothetical protein